MYQRRGPETEDTSRTSHPRGQDDPPLGGQAWTGCGVRLCPSGAHDQVGSPEPGTQVEAHHRWHGISRSRPRLSPRMSPLLMNHSGTCQGLPSSAQTGLGARRRADDQVSLQSYHDVPGQLHQQRSVRSCLNEQEHCHEYDQPTRGRSHHVETTFQRSSLDTGSHLINESIYFVLSCRPGGRPCCLASWARASASCRDWV